MFQCENSRATVVGLGATGLSFARYLARRGARVTVVDGNPAPSGLAQLHSELPDVRFQAIDFANGELPQSEFVALSPGVPRSTGALSRAAKEGRPIIGDIELFARDVDPAAQVFAVTGSNGKTTTTALAGELLATARPDTRVAGNIGIPILDALTEAPRCQSWLLELSSFQLESTYSLRLRSAAVINVTDNHLDRYRSFFAYAAAKERIFRDVGEQVLNRSDAWSMSMRRSDVTRITTFGPDAPRGDDEYGLAVLDGESMLAHGADPILASEHLGVSGAHNAQNALAALAILRSVTLDPVRRADVLRSFKGMPHRCQLLGTIDGVSVIDDSKATTVIATRAALDGLARPTWLIAGGDSKGQDMAGLAQSAATWCKLVALIGRDAQLIGENLAVAGVPFRYFDSLEDATVAALDGAVAGDQVLLSPACASWDMFRNYGHRAEVFTLAVHAWAKSHGKHVQAQGDVQ